MTRPLSLATDKLYAGDPFSSAAVGIFDRLTEQNIPEIKALCESGLFGLLVISKKANKREILRVVADWYDEARGNTRPHGSVITRTDMQNWAACRVLAYIDINLYRIATGIEFRPVHLQRALFGDMAIEQSGREPKKILEQSTRKYAERLMSEDYFHQLATERRGFAGVMRNSDF